MLQAKSSDCSEYNTPALMAYTIRKLLNLDGNSSGSSNNLGPAATIVSPVPPAGAGGAESVEWWNAGVIFIPL